MFAIPVIAVIASYFFWADVKHKQAEMIKASANNEMEVNTFVIKSGNVEIFQDLPARVAASKISEIRPQVDGIIRKQIFEEGSFVKAGQQLYQIDPTLYKIAYSTAGANLKTLEAKKNRYAKLLELDAVSKQEYDDAVAAYEQARGEVSRTQANLDYSKVYAPISGYIGKSNLTEGTLVTVNQATVLTTITQLDPIFVDMVLPSKDALKLTNQKKIPVSVLIDGVEHGTTGILKFAEVFVDESTDSVRLRATFSNKDKKLLPGMFVNARLHLKKNGTITVPQRSTNRGPDGNLVVLIVGTDNIVKSRIIKAEQTIGDHWIVTEGLDDGDMIVYEGFQKVTDGAKIKPLPVSLEEGQ